MTQILRTCSRALTASVLCVLMAEQPLLMAATKPTHAPAVDPAGTIQGDDRILHALNRFTYGPRPGDVEAVKAMGLDRWFEQQLNPENLDNSDLQARLANYPAMQLTESQLQARFPNNQMIRAVSNGLIRLPTDPIEHAIYSDQVYFYEKYKRSLDAGDAAGGAKGTAKTAAAKAGPAMAASNDMQPAMAGGDGDSKSDGDSMMMGGMAPNATADPEADKANSKKNAMKRAAQQGGKLMSQEDAEAILNLPPQQRFDKMLSLTPAQLLAFREGVKAQGRGQMLNGLKPEQREILGALGNSRQVISGEIFATNLLRDVYSTHQLQEVMTDFWLNHFNIYIRKNEITPYQISDFERLVIAPNALGHFEDLLVATAKSPAMMDYLDNWLSVGPDSPAAKRGFSAQPITPNAMPSRFADNLNPDAKAQLQQAVQSKKASGLNENYARELMELQTLGVNGGYTQQDVTEVAKVFTGWTIDRPYRGGGFTFDDHKHEPGVKTVLGKTIPEDGKNEGLTVLHMLATSPQTAHFISQELAVRFVADVPPPALVDRMAATFLSSNGDIKAVLTTMYKSPEFWSKDVYRAKVKTPSEFVLSAVRASDVQMRTPLPLEISLERLGMPLFGCQPPTGYYWRASDWVSTSALVSRMNFALALSANALPGITTDWSGMLNEDGIASTKPTTAGLLTPPEKEQRLESLLMDRPVSDKTRQTVLTEAETISIGDAAAKFPIDPNDIADLNGGDDQGGGKRQSDGNLQKLMGRMQPNAAPADKQASVMAGLLIGSPEFQRR